MLALDQLDSSGAFFNEQCCIGECQSEGEDPEDPPPVDPPEDPPVEEEPNLCADRCDDDGTGGFSEDEDCQCDSGCSEFGDCCEGPTTVLCAE